jgi:parallel beta-helix repeat protein
MSSISSISQQGENNSIITSNLVIHVDSDNSQGPWYGSKMHPYQLIQDAVDQARDNQIIHIASGIYKETVVINKMITLQGEEKNNTIIDGQYEHFIVSVQNNDVHLRDLTFQNSAGGHESTAIFLNASNCTIINCQFFRTKTGIRSIHQQNILISYCLFYGNGEGIYLYQNKNFHINNCTFYKNGLGLNINETENGMVITSNTHTNGIGFFIISSTHINLIRCGIYNNNDNQGGVFIDCCNQITIFNCIINHNGFGIKTSNCHDITIKNSTISYNTHAGILNSDQSKNITISHCEITKNLRISIYNTQSEIICIKNNIYNSICGLYCEESVCYFQNNWWGSKFGPGFIETYQQDNIIKVSSTVEVFPWEKQKIPNNGASWKIKGFYKKPSRTFNDTRNFSLPGIDTDYDGIPDWWEELYGYKTDEYEDHYQLDPDHDGLNNIEECYTAPYGSNPHYKDIFLEFDWMESHVSTDETNKPNDDYIQKAIDIFAKQDIALHIDVGNHNGGEQIPYKTNFSFSDLRDFYWDYFLHQDLNNPRKGIFHYGVICDYGPANGFAFIGWDSLDSFCICAETLKNNHEIPYPRQRFIIGSSIHELGHNLGLTVDDHGGNDNKIATIIGTIQWMKYLTYPSCMNYFYTYLILGFSDGTHGPGDFDDWSSMDYSFFKNTHFILPDRYI